MHRAIVILLTLLSALSSLAQTAKYDVEVEDHSTPSSLGQFKTTEISVEMVNRGTATWTPGAFNVSYHWLSPDGEMVVLDGIRTPVPHEVRPGESLPITATVKTPRSTGAFLLQWDVVEEGVTWLSQQDPTPVAGIPVSIVPGSFSHAYSIISGSTPRIMWAGTSDHVELRLRNDGTEGWDTHRQINVSYHWKHDDEERAYFEGMRTAVDASVAPRDTTTVNATLQAPREAGLYRLQWDMVEEGVTWFNDVDPTPPDPAIVLVLPNPLKGPAFATLAAIVALSLVLFITYRPAQKQWVLDLILLTDLVWLFVAMNVKQSAVLAAANRRMVEGAGWTVVSGVAVFTIVTALLPRRIRPWIVVAINATISVLILADLVHLRFFNDVLSLASFGAAGQTGQIAEGIGSLLEWDDLWLFIDFVPGIVLSIFIYRNAGKTGQRPARWLAIGLLPLLLPGLLTIGRITSAEKGKFVQVFQNIFIVQEIGPVNFHLFDIARETTTALTSPELTPERRQEIVDWFRSTAPRRAGTGEMFGLARGKNLVMIQVESMQGFVIGLEIDGQEITPNLNQWSRSEALWLSNCSDQTAQGRTSDAEFATQVSLIPPRKGTVAFRFGHNTYQGLGDVLHDHGYATLSAIPFGRAFWNRRVTLPEYGYRENLFKDDFEPGVRVGWGLNDKDFLLQMVPKLEALDQPFAALLITLSNHHPYVAFPDELKELDLGDLEETSIGNYLHSMHHFDKALASFVEEMARAGLLQDTMIALWGDHGAGLPWNYEMAALANTFPTEPEFYRVAEIPVLLGIPGSGRTGEWNIRCGQIDLAPTLLALLGIDPAPYPFMGRNLFGDPGDEPVLSLYTVWLTNELLYLDKGPDLEAGRCYAVDTLKRVEIERCRNGDWRAKEKLRISKDVIVHDLHIPIMEALESLSAH